MMKDFIYLLEAYLMFFDIVGFLSEAVGNCVTI
jgi:hypothetical protein